MTNEQRHLEYMEGNSVRDLLEDLYGEAVPPALAGRMTHICLSQDSQLVAFRIMSTARSCSVQQGLASIASIWFVL